MLKRIFNKMFPLSTPAVADHPSPVMATLPSAESEQQVQQGQQDQLYAVKRGGKEIASKLFMAMSTEKGIHLESLLSALGALAG